MATDETIMDAGKHKGEKLANIPASYLIWCYDNDRLPGYCRTYVKQNYTLLLKEQEDEKGKR